MLHNFVNKLYNSHLRELFFFENQFPNSGLKANVEEKKGRTKENSNDFLDIV